MTDLTDIAERFKRDTAAHEMSVLHDDGLYRHVRFMRRVVMENGQTSLTSSYYFDLVTWPGNLVVNGDCGTFAFARTDDMFGFFRGQRINPQYWAEKVRARDRSGVTEYSQESFRQQVAEDLAVAEAEFPGVTEAAEREFFGSYAEFNTEYEHDARRALDEFRFPASPSTLEAQFSFADTFEWDLHDYGWHYLWCCHAIVFGIGLYDAAKAAAQQAKEAVSA